ncbi:hypothetical protein [Halococcus saccharolyticus]|uniref:hypothetical protein n=1 Tax=Halococcus saccharolyticus TaxID=62319 RepID=UPI000ACE2E90|nr:hypothetical protein [Halococcus saccharolyticus]
MTENAFTGDVTVGGSAHDAITTEQYRFVERSGAVERHRLVEPYPTIIACEEVGA